MDQKTHTLFTSPQVIDPLYPAFLYQTEIDGNRQKGIQSKLEFDVRLLIHALVILESVAASVNDKSQAKSA